MELSLQPALTHNRILNDRSWGIFLAFSFHAALFLAGNLGLLQKPEFGMDFSDGAAEVDLVAAPAPMAVPAAETSKEAPAFVVPPVIDKEDVVAPKKIKALPTPPVAAPVANAILRTDNLDGPLGDGSSPVAGSDATTLHRAGSSGSYFQPGYYRNPPPPYPPEARKLKQEGRVILQVTVNAEGRASDLSIMESSGYPLLDQAALQSVKTWRFKPATLGGLRVQTVAHIPIRFQLSR